METEIIIAADDPVRLVSAVVERMDIQKIERSYSQDGRNEYPPRILLKVMIYHPGALLICGTLWIVLHILALMRSICYAFFNIL